MKDYINVEKMFGTIVNIYRDCRDGFITDENRDCLLCEVSDDFIEESAWEMAIEFNSDMGKYLNMKDHKINGNFNNIDYDYPHHINGEFGYDSQLVDAMIERLNSGEKSEQADADRDWLVDWFFETFGTFGISYNFSEFIGEILYQYENEAS